MTHRLYFIFPLTFGRCDDPGVAMHQPPESSMDQTTDTTPNEAVRTPATGDDVLNILAGVEDQLNRLRTVQKSQDQAIMSLADRARALQRAEDEASRVRAQLEEARESIQREREQWEQQRALHEAELHKRHEDLQRRNSEVTRQSSDFNAERERVAAMARQCERKQREFDERSRQLEAEHTELLHRVDQAEKNVGELIHQLETSQQELAIKTEQVVKATQDATAFRKRAAALENAVQQASSRAEQSEREAAELAKLADRERQAIEEQLVASQSQLASAQAQLEKAAKSRDAAQSELKTLHERASALEKTVHGLQSQLTERTTQLSDQQGKLELASRKLSEFARVLAEQTPQLERGAAALAMVEEQHEQIERLTKQLAEHKLRTDPEEMDRRDQRIAELTEALRQARGQAAGQQGIAEVERRNAELTAEVNRLKIDLENAQLVAEQTRLQLTDRVDAEASTAAHDASLAEHAAKVAALTAEIEQLHAAAAENVKKQLEDQAQRHQQELDQAHGADADVINALRTRVTQLEQQLSEAETAAAFATTESTIAPTENTGIEQDQFAQKLRDKAERITTVAEHLRRRRTRLAKLRLLLSHRSTVAEKSLHGQMRTEEVLKIEQEKAQLAEVRQALTVSERTMIRKWACQRAVAVVLWLMVILAACGTASWFLADAVVPAKVAASVTLEAKNFVRNPMSAEQADSWRDWHTSMLSDPMFHQTVMKRLVERRLDDGASSAAIAARLANDLSVDSGHDGRMTLTLAGTDRHMTPAVLDVVASTLAMESNRQASNRADNTPAVMVGERRDGSTIRYASLNPTPIADSRIAAAGPIFAVLLAGCIALFIGVYRKLNRSRSVFEEGNAGLLME